MPDRKIVPINPPKSGPRFGVLPHDDYTEIMGLIAAYGRFYDDNRVEDFVDLMTEDAAFYANWPGVAPEEISGKAALKEFFGGARAHCVTTGVQPRHYATNVIIASATAHTAEVTAGMLYSESISGGEVALKMIGQYDYHVKKQDGRWNIARWSMRYDK